MLLSLLAAGCTHPAAAAPAPSSAATPATFALEPVRDGLWRYTAGAYHGVLLVTSNGVAVTDPLSHEAATWLRGEIARRFDQPIRYVLYSHNHPDHAYGGEALDGPGVVYVAHALAARDWARTRARVRMPDITFQEALTVTLDGHPIELRYHGPNNGVGSVSMRFVDQHSLFVVDWIVVGRVPYRDLHGYDLNGMIDSTREALALEFDTFVGGHADISDRAGVARYLAYLEALHGEVLEGMLAGHDLATIQREADLSAFSDLASFDAWRNLNVQGAYEQLRASAYVDNRPEVPAPD